MYADMMPSPFSNISFHSFLSLSRPEKNYELGQTD
jgi:hypothetical protein